MAVCGLSKVDNRLDKSFGAEEMQVQIGSDYADNASKKAGAFKALGCKRGIIRLSACRQLLRGVRTRQKKAPFHGARCYTSLFARFNGTMTESESSNTYIAGYEHSFFPSRPGLCVLGMLEASQGPLGGRTHVHGFLDAAEPDRPHEYGRLSVAFDHGDGLGTPKVSYFVAH